jgi:hypothetical protein
MMKSSVILILILFVGLAAKAGEFPLECIRFSLDESFSRIPVGARSDYFVKCSSEKAEPQRGQARPRYSEYEIKELHQSFLAITDCLDVEPQSIFPKLMMESGFHVQIQSLGGDAGIGQLTSKAIGDVDANLATYKKMIYESTKPSCRWIRARTQSRNSFWQPSLGKSKCMVMARPNNPLKNLLYTVIFHKLNQGYVNNKFEEKNIAGLLKEAGYPGTDFTALKRILVALGYNTGGSTAVRNLQDYLFSRIDFIQRKKMEFNVGARTVGEVTAFDFDFTIGLQAFNDRKAELKNALQQQNLKLTDVELDAGVQRLLRNTSVSQYSFPEWLKVWQSHGGPGYVSSLVGFSLRLDQKFGAGVCSNARSFQLWRE